MTSSVKSIRQQSWLHLPVILLLALCAASCVATRPTDFNGVWFVTEYDEIIRPNENDPPYTAEAVRRLDFFNTTFDPVQESAVMLCNPIGMPWAMLARARDYPREVYQTDDRVIVFFEYMDEYRVIYLNRSEVPDNWLGSKMGYSVGHWDGDELVVETSGFLDSGDATSFPRSDEARTIERWRLVDHPDYGRSLEVQMEVIDPVIYTEPRYGRSLWKLGDSDAVVGVYGCPATLWEDFVDQRIEATENASETE